MKCSRGLARLALVSALAACAGARPEADLVIRNARLWAGDGTLLDNATIVLQEGRILAAGKDVGDWRGREQMDAAGRTVLPGLIDTHVHLLALASESAESVALYRRDKLAGVLSEFLSQGVTTVRSVGDPLPAIAQLREELRSGKLKGPQLLISGPFLTAQEGHPASTVCGDGSWAWCRTNLVRELRDAEGVRQAVAELAAQKVDFIKVVYEDLAGAKLPQSLLREIVKQSQARGLQVIVHAAPGDLAIEAIQARVDGFVHLPFGAVEPQVLVEAVGERPISATLGLLTPLPDGQGKLHGPHGYEWDDDAEQLRKEMLATAAALWKGGALLAFGTDTAMFSPRQSWFHEAGALLDAGLTPGDVLIAATRNAARALGLEEEIGTLEAGKRADLVMVEGHPEADLKALESIAAVIQNGKVVVDRR